MKQKKEDLTLFFLDTMMGGLTDESPTFCFDRDELSMVELKSKTKILMILVFFLLLLGGF